MERTVTSRVTQGSPRSAVPSRFHVLHLHVKLDWLRENWTVSHSNIYARSLHPVSLARALSLFLSASLFSPFFLRDIHSSERAHSRVARKCVRQLYLHISNYFEEDAKWSVAQWSDSTSRFIYVMSFLFFFLLFNLLFPLFAYMDAHTRSDPSRNRYHKWSPPDFSARNWPRRSPTREHISNEGAFSHAYVMDDSRNRSSVSFKYLLAMALRCEFYFAKS